MYLQRDTDGQSTTPSDQLITNRTPDVKQQSIITMKTTKDDFLASSVSMGFTAIGKTTIPFSPSPSLSFSLSSSPSSITQKTYPDSKENSTKIIHPVTTSSMADESSKDAKTNNISLLSTSGSRNTGIT